MVVSLYQSKGINDIVNTVIQHRKSGFKKSQELQL